MKKANCVYYKYIDILTYSKWVSLGVIAHLLVQLKHYFRHIIKGKLGSDVGQPGIRAGDGKVSLTSLNSNCSCGTACTIRSNCCKFAAKVAGSKGSINVCCKFTALRMLRK